MKLVATMIADLDMTPDQMIAAAQILQDDLRRTFQDRFGGAVSIRIGITPDATWDTLADHAKRGAIETLARMQGGDLRVRRFIESPDGRKEF